MPSRLEAVGLSRIATVLSQGQTPSEVIEPFAAAQRSREGIDARFSVERMSLTRTAWVGCGGEISLPRRNQGYQTTW
jgi:hypothetical protein